MKSVLKGARQIVCIVPKGKGEMLVAAISRDHGIYNSNFNHARGVGRSANIRNRGLGEQREKDVFSVTVDETIADDIFEYLYYKGELDQPHGGMIYMQDLPSTTVMEIPDTAASRDS